MMSFVSIWSYYVQMSFLSQGIFILYSWIIISPLTTFMGLSNGHKTRFANPPHDQNIPYSMDERITWI